MYRHEKERSFIQDALLKIGISPKHLDLFLAFFSNEQINELPRLRIERERVKTAARIKLQAQLPHHQIRLIDSPQLSPRVRLRNVRQALEDQLKGESIRSRIKVGTEPLKIAAPATNDPETATLLQDLVDIQSNEIAKRIFVDELRRRLGGAHVGPDGQGSDSWVSNNELISIANKYNVPFMAIKSHHHWHLVLSEPTINLEKKCLGVRVYDPKMSGERYILLDDWTKDAQLNWKNQLGITIPISLAGKALLDQGQYNLSLRNDSQELSNVKQEKKQTDDWNCGPICLFQAILLAAVAKSQRPEFRVFRARGLKQFEEDYGIDVLTRSEILRP